MRADTQAVSIEAPCERVFDFVADGGNLPRWAIGFARGARRVDEGWMVETAGGSVSLRIGADRTTGVVDFRITPAPGVGALAASRVIPRGAASEYVFTQFQAPGMPDDAFAASVRALAHELSVLKALMEVECPA